MPSAASVRARRWLPVAAIALAVSAASAQVLYKWTDEQGKVHYGDQPPKNFKGGVTRIEPDAAQAPAAPMKPAAAKENLKAAPEKAPEDVAARRRAERARLASNVERAKARLEAAKAALENGGAPGLDERQIVRQHYAKGTAPATPRSNCREVTKADGKKATMCPAMVPNEAYYERIRELEEAVKRAQLELEEAERAYRRGVD